MYLPGMTATEIIRLLESDREDCRRKSMHLYEDSMKCARKAIKADTSLSVAEYWKNPKSGSEYVLCSVIENKKMLYDPMFMYFPIIRDKGINLLLVSSLVCEVTQFIPHFFDQYEARMKDVIKKPRNRMDLVLQFINRNWRIGTHSVDKMRRGNTEYELSIPDGAIMMNWDGERRVMKGMTFVNDGMFYSEQRNRLSDVRQHNSQSLKEYIRLQQSINNFNEGIRPAWI